MVCTHFVTRLSATLGANFTALHCSTTSGLAAASAAAAASTKTARAARATQARRSIRSRLQFRAFVAVSAVSIELSIASSAARFRHRARTSLHGPIRRNRLIQIFILLFEVHEIGDVQERVAFQSDIDKGRLHAWQHAGHSALIYRA